MAILSDGSDLLGVQRPQDLKYMKYVRIALMLMGGWPGKALGERERFRLQFQLWNVLMFFYYVTGGAVYIRNNAENIPFFELVETYITVLMTSVCFTRCITLVSKDYDKMVLDFISEIHLLHQRNGSEYSKKVNLFTHKLCHFFTLYTYGFVVFLVFFFNLTPLLNNISNGGFSRHPPANMTYQHAVYLELPFDYQHNFNGFIVIFILNWYSCSMCGAIFLFYDLIVALVVFHLWGHLKILKYNLQYFPSPGFKGNGSNVREPGLQYTNEEEIEVSAKLKEIVKHQQFILRHCANLSDTVGFNVAMYYLFHQIIGCLLLLECSALDPKALIRFGSLTLGYIKNLVQISVIFELLRKMTDPLIQAVYNMPWECMKVKNQRVVLILLMRTQVPLGLKAMGLVEVGVLTMATVFKTTISYFIILQAMTAK